MGIESVSNSAAAIKAYQNTAQKVTDEKVSENTKEAVSSKKNNSDSIEISSQAKEATKGMSVDQLKALQEEQVSTFKNMLSTMLNRQAGLSQRAAGKSLELSKDLFKNLTVTPEEALAAQQAISADGEWGVEAVAGRIMDMAVALSGGDTSKLQTLKDAVDKGFSMAGKQWGDKLPSICEDTRAEVNKRFDYWKEHGSLDGYGMDSEE